ncbi:MAG TPA: MJ1255/VC2487 family glycosyltransferase [Cellvibrio sp.]|nr:MJ1255/VC2487 family glycosyltransferase [Cellvibrio sp.]
MRILYGVQGTGNGHTTRARIMAKAFAEAGVEVDWVFSGRPRDGYFDMEAFDNFQSYRGLTFKIRSGRILFFQTLMNCNLYQFYQDINQVNVEGYDFIINDFEPVSAWAARRAGKKVIGISHQNSFLYDIPKHGNNFIIDLFMRSFAPVTQPIGLHWHHFDQPILPPLVEQSHYPNESRHKHYLVYLPFSSPGDIEPHLRQFPDYHFYIYQNVTAAKDDGNLHIRPFSREGFQQDLHSCEGVICSAGFELPSEAIQLGKKILALPLAGQMEQKSNAVALNILGYGTATEKLTSETIAQWLLQPKPASVTYPNVAKALAEWLLQREGRDFAALQKQLWSETLVSQ